MTDIRCVDCVKEGVSTKRPAPHGGPRSARCATHWREFRKAAKKRNAARKVENVYGISAEDYDVVLAYQNGRCAVCQRANGTARRLAVDHRHDTGEVFGLLCSPCNYTLLGRYDTAALTRAINYLLDPPARKALGRSVIVPNAREELQ